MMQREGGRRLNLSLFDDPILSSSDLNRRSGEVLRLAADRPVTIARTDGDLVIMKRTLAADLVRAGATLADVVAELARLVAAASRQPVDPRFAARLELGGTILLAGELVEALGSAPTFASGLNGLATVLHEWSETMSWADDDDAMSKVIAAEHAAEQQEPIPIDETNPSGDA